MPVLVRVRLAPIPGEGVGMPMMGVVPMAVCVYELFMSVLVLVPLSEVQPHPGCHQYRGDPKAWRSRFTKDCDGNYSTDERGRGEIGARASRAQPPEGKNKEHQADAVADETDGGCGCDQRRRRPRGTESKSQPHVSLPIIN